MEEREKKEIMEMIGNALRNSYVKKLGDTPVDDLQLAPRKYVNAYGSVAGRPSSSVATLGQRFFALETSIPMTWNGTNWVNGVGSVVAPGN